MSMKRVSFFSIILLSLCACGGGGGKAAISSLEASASSVHLSSFPSINSSSSSVNSSSSFFSSSISTEPNSSVSSVVVSSSSIHSVNFRFENNNDLELFVGDFLNNSAIGDFEPGDVRYRSENSLIASVDEITGAVTAASPGSARIIAALKSKPEISAGYNTKVVNPSVNFVALLGESGSLIQLSDQAKGVHISKTCDSSDCVKQNLGVFEGAPLPDMFNKQLTDYLLEFSGRSVQLDAEESRLSQLFHHQSLIFQNKIWVFGGERAGYITNTILSSSDGAHWNRWDNSNAFPGRQEHQVVFFKNKLWLIGGYGYLERDVFSTFVLNDIWSSDDGIVWRKALASAPFEGRRKHKVASFAGKLWLIGGVDIKGVGLTDLWSSVDGVSWVLEKADVVGEKLYSHSLTVFEDKLWLMNSNRMWSSVNGVDWVANSKSLPFSGSGNVFIHQTHLWSSSIGSGVTGTVFWKSLDGLSWSKVDSSYLPYSQYPQVVSHKEGMFVLGGYESLVSSGVRASVDGKMWRNTLQQKFSPRYAHAVTEFDGKIWMVGGLLNNSASNDVWTSADGLIWTEVLDAAPFAKRSDHNLVSWSGKLFLIGGLGKNDVWSSVDGSIWVQEKEHAEFPSAETFELVSYSGQLWLFGSDNSVWISADAINWVKRGDITAFSKRSGYRLSVFKEKLWLVGGLQSSDRAMKSDVWTSDDGVNWKLVTEDGGFSPIAWHGLTVFDHKLVISAGSDAVGSSVRVWASEDGLKWSYIATVSPSRTDHRALVFNGQLILLGGLTSFAGPINDILVSSNAVDWKKVVSHKVNFKN